VSRGTRARPGKGEVKALGGGALEALGDEDRAVRILGMHVGVNGDEAGCIQGPVNLLYMTSHVYNPADELRILYNDPGIPFDWLKGPPIK
jgi:hypothetical protein